MCGFPLATRPEQCLLLQGQFELHNQVIKYYCHPNYMNVTNLRETKKYIIRQADVGLVKSNTITEANFETCCEDHLTQGFPAWLHYHRAGSHTQDQHQYYADNITRCTQNNTLTTHDR